MIYYVEQTAAPMGDGTEKRPFRTIGEAAALAQRGTPSSSGKDIPGMGLPAPGRSFG